VGRYEHAQDNHELDKHPEEREYTCFDDDVKKILTPFRFTILL
jgi:hypothetical protein